MLRERGMLDKRGLSVRRRGGGEAVRAGTSERPV